MRSAILTFMAAGLCALITPVAHADDAHADVTRDEPAPIATEDPQAAAAREAAARLTVGVGFAHLPDYEGSNDYRITPLPAANGAVGGMSLTLMGNRLSMDLIPDRQGNRWNVQAGPVIAVNFNRTDRKLIDDPRVAALDEVNMALELGGYIGIGKTGLITSDYDTLQFSLSYRHDINKAHKSGIWQPSVNYMTPLSRKAVIGIFASAEIVQGRYARTYYGVTPAGSVISGLPAFTPSGGQKDISFGGAFTHALTGDLTKGLSVVVGGQYKKLLGDFADSPVVSIAGSRHQWIVGGGLAMTF